jgi:peroxiredoxin
MSLTPSTMLKLGTRAPDFNLMDLNGKRVTLNTFKNHKALLVVFMCNHCPYVRHIIEDFTKIATEYQSRGIGIVGINSNDVESYKADSPPKMLEFAQKHNLTFAYLYDETQETAKKYKAACTPDFFLFDHNRNLVYRGQMDDSRPENGKSITGKDLRAAFDAVLKDKPIIIEQKPSMGCNIKWKPGNEPDYY